MIVTEKTVKLELNSAEVVTLSKAIAAHLVQAAPNFETMEFFSAVHSNDIAMLASMSELAGLPGFYKQTLTGIQLNIGTAKKGRRKRASATIVKDKTDPLMNLKKAKKLLSKVKSVSFDEHPGYDPRADERGESGPVSHG